MRSVLLTNRPPNQPTCPGAAPHRHGSGLALIKPVLRTTA